VAIYAFIDLSSPLPLHAIAVVWGKRRNWWLSPKINGTNLCAMAAMVIYLLLRRSTTVRRVHKIIRSASRLVHSDHSRPAGLENLHVGIGSLIRAMEPNKEERWERWRRTRERCRDWNFFTWMLHIIYLTEAIGVGDFFASLHIVNSPINVVWPFNNLLLCLTLVKRTLRERWIRLPITLPC